MRKHALPPAPSALAVGLLEDIDRALFLVGRDGRGEERLEMPCVEVMPGEDPVAALGAAFRAQTGIDAAVHEVRFQRKYNAGSRKRKILVPALVFRVTAKHAECRPSAGFCGYKWLEQKDLAGKKLSKKSEWLRM
jgi:hypothetical protein